MKWLNHFYEELWYHIQSLWIKSKWARRPFTFIFHDFSHAVPVIFWGIQLLLLGFGAWLVSPWVLAFYIMGVLIGHISWGGHKVGEQEDPEYTERRTR